MQSRDFVVPILTENSGSGFRAGQAYQLTDDVLSAQPTEISSSANYVLQGRPLAMVDSPLPSCGLFIDGNADLTTIVDINLSLICGHRSGCTGVQLSNNGVGWSATLPYSMAKPWSLIPNDGARKVFAKFQNGLGNWSGVCSDSIVLDTTAPRVSISPTGGTYMDPQSVAVTANEPGTIKYTTDGTDPKTSPTALVYSAPVSVAADSAVKAFSTDSGGLESSIVSETYEICTGSGLSISGKVMDATRNKPMPLVVITLNTGQTTNSDPSGNYAFGGLNRGYYTIVSVTAPVAGYVTYQSTFKLCKTSIAHDIVLTKDATVFGTDTNSGYSSEGVNTSTGNFAYKMSDLAIPGRGPSVVFERAYNSQDATGGPLGYGWTWNYNVSLTDGPNGEIVMRWGDGRTEVWGPDGSGGFTPMYGVFSSLIQNPDTSFTLRRKDLIEYRFDTSRRLASVVDEFGNTIAFTYSGSSLTTITDTSGRVISLSYDASSRITNVLDPIGRSVSFTYDGAGNLVSATDMGGKTTRYTYDADHQMRTLIDPLGNIAITNVYDPAWGVVVSQRDAVGGETRYVYDIPTRTTTILDALGNTSKHRFDDRLRLVQEDDPAGHSTHRVYDARGNLESVADRKGQLTTFTYDANGNVLTKTEPLGRVTSATYDAASNPLTKTDALGYSQVFEYDPATQNLVASYACGAIPAATCAGNPTVKKTTYAYDPATGKLLNVTDAVGDPLLERTTTYQYDVFGNQVAVIDALGNTSLFTYDGVGRKLVEEHPLDRATAYEYDSMDRLISVTDALGGQADYLYDDAGNKTGHLDARGHWTNFAYDAKGRLVSTTGPLLNTEQYVYDALDRRTEVTNVRGFTSSVVYDAVGNVIHQVDALGNAIRHEYDANGNRTATTDPRGRKTTFTYDALNRLVTTTDPLGNTETVEYDLNGNRTKVTDALGKVTEFAYDAFNRLVSVRDAIGNTTTNTYDLLGRLVKVRDARGNETLYEYDKLDRLVKVTDAAGGIVTAGYDVLGNRTRVTDPRGHDTTYVYDVLNRLTTETDPLGNAAVMAYDAVGNLRSLSNADGTTSYAYDVENRVTEILFPDSTTAAYTYDAKGNRTKLVDIAGTATYAYDALDRLSSVTDVFGLTVGYTYDANGNRSSTRYPGNRSVIYRFDELNRLLAVEDWGGVTTTYTYDNAGRLAGQVMGNGSTVTYTYDDSGRLVTKEDRTAGGTVIASYTYTLDANGNRTGLSFTQPLMPDVDAEDSAFTHNTGNQVVANGPTTYTYDGKGNRHSATTGAVTTQYAYNFQNRLTSVADGRHVWQYGYNSDGKRLYSTKDGQQTRYLLDLNGSLDFVLAELDPSNVVKTYYVYGDGLLNSVDGASGERTAFHFDPLGTTVATRSLINQPIEEYAYTPYGEPAWRGPVRLNRFGFGGKFGVVTEDSGLLFMRARYYDPGTKRFLSRDPLPGQMFSALSMNGYSFCSAAPVLFVDPTGEEGVMAALPDDYFSGRTPTELQEDQYTLDYADRRDDALSNGAGWLGNDMPAGFGFFAAIARAAVDKLPLQFSTKEKLNLVIDSLGKIDTLFGFLKKNPGDLADATLGVVHGSASVSLGAGLHATDQIVLNPVATSLTPKTGPVNGTTPLSGPPAAAPSETPSTRGSVPRSFLKVTGFARSFFAREFKLLLDPDFLDSRTLTGIERAIDNQVMALQGNRYGYRTKKQKEEAKKRRVGDVSESSARLYSLLVSALSKHDVIVRDLSSMPAGATGGVAIGGVYGRQ